MTKGPNPKAPPMPTTTVSVNCDECGEQIIELPLNTNYLAALLFKARKEHAKERHDWKEQEPVTANGALA